MRKEYITQYAREELENYSEKLSEGKSIEECFNQSITDLKRRITFNNAIWFSDDVRATLIELYRMLTNQYPDKKEKFKELVKNAIVSLGYEVEENLFNADTNQTTYDEGR